MKIKAVVLAVVFALLLCVPAAAKTYSQGDISVDIPDEFGVITPEYVEEHPEIAEIFEGQTDKSLKAHMEDNGILFIAVEKNEVRQIQLRVEEGAPNSYVKNVGDLSLLSNESIKESAGEIARTIEQKTDSKVKEDYRVVQSHSGIKAIRFELLAKDAEYACIQYVTVRNGKLYSLTGYDALGSNMDFLADAFDGLSIKKDSDPITVQQGNQLLSTVITVLLIVVAVLVIGRIVATFIHDFKNRDNDVREFVKIKRRKF